MEKRGTGSEKGSRVGSSWRKREHRFQDRGPSSVVLRSRCTFASVSKSPGVSVSDFFSSVFFFHLDLGHPGTVDGKGLAQGAGRARGPRIRHRRETPAHFVLPIRGFPLITRTISKLAVTLPRFPYRFGGVRSREKEGTTVRDPRAVRSSLYSAHAGQRCATFTVYRRARADNLYSSTLLSVALLPLILSLRPRLLLGVMPVFSLFFIIFFFSAVPFPSSHDSRLEEHPPRRFPRFCSCICGLPRVRDILDVFPTHSLK